MLQRKVHDLGAVMMKTHIYFSQVAVALGREPSIDGQPMDLLNFLVTGVVGLG